MTEWGTLPLECVPLDKLVWPCHDIDPEHLHEHDARMVTNTPICVEELVDGSYFVHDGRHRAIRSMRRGNRTILAFVYRKWVW